jgi:hypothetical protein
MQPADFIPALTYLESQRGVMGPYADLGAYSSAGFRYTVPEQQAIALGLFAPTSPEQRGWTPIGTPSLETPAGIAFPGAASYWQNVGRDEWIGGANRTQINTLDNLIGGKTVAAIPVSQGGGITPPNDINNAIKNATEQGFLGGLIGSWMFWENRVEGVKGAIAQSLYFGTAGIVDLSGYWGLQKTEPALTQFRQEKATDEQRLSQLQTEGKQKFGVTPAGQIKIDVTNPEAVAFSSEYATAKAQYQGLISTGKEQGILIAQGGQYIENPDLTYKFGEFTKWV